MNNFNWYMFLTWAGLIVAVSIFWYGFTNSVMKLIY